jgi:hypothetical protein
MDCYCSRISRDHLQPAGTLWTVEPCVVRGRWRGAQVLPQPLANPCTAPTRQRQGSSVWVRRKRADHPAAGAPRSNNVKSLFPPSLGTRGAVESDRIRGGSVATRARAQRDESRAPTTTRVCAPRDRSIPPLSPTALALRSAGSPKLSASPLPPPRALYSHRARFASPIHASPPRHICRKH